MAKRLKKLEINEVSLVEVGANHKSDVLLFKSAKPTDVEKVDAELAQTAVDALAEVVAVVDSVSAQLQTAIDEEAPVVDEEEAGVVDEEAPVEQSKSAKVSVELSDQINLLKNEIEAYKAKEKNSEVKAHIASSFAGAPSIYGLDRLYSAIWGTDSVQVLDQLGQAFSHMTKGAIATGPIGSTISKGVENDPQSKLESLIAKHLDSCGGVRGTAIAKAIEEYPGFYREFGAFVSRR